MPRTLTIIGLLAGLIATPAMAQEMAGTDVAAAEIDTTGMTPLERWETDRVAVFEAGEVDLAEFQWIARPVVIFADTPADPRFQRQMDLISQRPEELASRDVVVITDTDPTADSPIREALRPRGFMLAILGKDGTVLIRKPLPWDLREITRNIDKLPLRQQEIIDRRAADLLATQTLGAEVRDAVVEAATD